MDSELYEEAVRDYEKVYQTEKTKGRFVPLFSCTYSKEVETSMSLSPTLHCSELNKAFSLVVLLYLIDMAVYQFACYFIHFNHLKVTLVVFACFFLLFFNWQDITSEQLFG